MHTDKWKTSLRCPSALPLEHWQLRSVPRRLSRRLHCERRRSRDPATGRVIVPTPLYFSLRENSKKKLKENLCKKSRCRAGFLYCQESALKRILNTKFSHVTTITSSYPCLPLFPSSALIAARNSCADTPTSTISFDVATIRGKSFFSLKAWMHMRKNHFVVSHCSLRFLVKVCLIFGCSVNAIWVSIINICDF